MPKGVEGPDVSILFGQIQVRDNPPSAEVMPEDFPDTEPPTAGEIGMGTPNGLEIDRDLDSQIAAFERGVPAVENQQTLLPPGSNPTACHHRLGQQPTDTRPGWLFKRALLVVTGMDLENAAGDLAAFQELLETDLPMVPVSIVDSTGLDELAKQTFDALHIMRIYTKQPGKDVDREKPFTLPQGSSVGELARLIHKDVAESLKFARVWGASVFDGQSVKAAHILEEGDVVEIHW